MARKIPAEKQFRKLNGYWFFRHAPQALGIRPI
jgi:hypothetical protein